MGVGKSSVTSGLRRLRRHYVTGECIQSIHKRLRGVLPIDLRRIELRGSAVKLQRLQLFMYQLRVHLRYWSLMRATTGTVDGSKKLVLIDIHTSSGIVHRRTMKCLACSCTDLEWVMVPHLAPVAQAAGEDESQLHSQKGEDTSRSIRSRHPEGFQDPLVAAQVVVVVDTEHHLDLY